MINQRAAALIIVTCFIIFTFYSHATYKLHLLHYFHTSNLYRSNISLNVLKKFGKREHVHIYTGTEDYLINTKGCYIPNYGKKIVIKKFKKSNTYCGDRAVFIDKTESYKIEFRIDKKIINKYSKNVGVQCFYHFASRSSYPRQEDKTLSYTEWTPFKNGTKATLLQEVITVKCNSTLSKTNSRTVYEDAYVFVKKLEAKKPKTKEKAWNVLIVGMDSMSRARVLSSMPRTSQYLQEHGWLDYKGYQKVGYNTFPNLMALFTGKKMDTVYSRCKKGMSKCNDLFVWSRFRDNGYLTAYGEDSLSLPDTFSRYNGFQIQPTHHYLRPFFLTGETQLGNVICTKHKPSAVDLLDYAFEFANTYERHNFFGIFWINSFSHNFNHIPTLLDFDIMRFFERLNETKVLKNTIIIFTSDHGTRYGNRIVPIEFYYDERLPTLFVWIPHDFRHLYEEKYYNLRLNQNRLVTPYDLYVTLEEIRNNFKTSNVKSEACPQCSSIFEQKSSYRTCTDAGVSKKWCSCHDMIKVDAKDAAVKTSLQLAVRYIQSAASLVKTKKCQACRPLQLKTVLRTHSYIDSSDSKTHYVVAWQMTPGAVSFEATVMKEGNNFTIVHPTHTISGYNRLSNCVLKPNDRQFCVCKATARKCT